jgi:hemerythrin-like domain-containing protein
VKSRARETEKARIPRVLRCLFEEHRHLAALVHVLNEKAGKEQPLRTSDYYLIRDIVGYMHDYPDAVHHPTENRLFSLLLERAPSKKKGVDRLMDDHRDVAEETRQLLELLDRAIENPGDSNEQAVRRACREFAAHQTAHMQFENRKMFPAAMEHLTADDFSQIEADFAAANDPLFGELVGKQHRLLYEFLLSPAENVSDRLTGARLFSLERLILAIDILENGAGAWSRRVADLAQELSEESRSAVSRLLKPDSPASVIGVPVNLAASVSRSLLVCSADLLGIYSTTLKKGVRAIFF